MIYRLLQQLFLSSAFILCLAPLRAAGVERLLQESDAVVVGTLTTGVASQTRVTFSLSVIRVLHGNVSAPSISVVHDWAGLLRGPDRVINQTQTGIWFLKKRADDTWDVIPSRPSMYRSILGLFLPASGTPPVRSASDGDLITRLLEEVTAMFQPGSGQDPEILAGAFDGVKASAVNAVLPTLRATGDAGIQAVAIAAMLESQTPDSFSEFVRMWPVIRAVPVKRFVLSALRDNWRDTNPDAVRRLAALAVTDTEVGPIAASTLAAIHTRETLPFLATLLFDSDPQVQFHGLYGISAFANGCPVKTRESVVSMQYLDCRQPSSYKTTATAGNLVFRPGTAEQQVAQVSFWRNWWQANPELH